MLASACRFAQLWVGICIAFCSQASHGEVSDSDPSLLEEILIIGSKSAAREVSGSASFLDETDLDRFDQIDLRKVLNQVAGVYIREEDGFGLRPNIGIRGAAAERSQKVTLMRDGVLITPAPYSAPAAYYVPNVSRIGSVEVLKGPSATAYGPHTVGGAINFGSLPLPVASSEGFVDLSAGSDGFYKLQGSYGENAGDFGFLVDVLSYGADGFKYIDEIGGDTGFERNDIGLKMSYVAPESRFDHRVTLLVEAGYEDPNET